MSNLTNIGKAAYASEIGVGDISVTMFSMLSTLNDLINYRQHDGKWIIGIVPQWSDSEYNWTDTSWRSADVRLELRDVVSGETTYQYLSVQQFINYARSVFAFSEYSFGVWDNQIFTAAIMESVCKTMPNLMELSEFSGDSLTGVKYSLLTADANDASQSVECHVRGSFTESFLSTPYTVELYLVQTSGASIIENYGLLGTISVTSTGTYTYSYAPVSIQIDEGNSIGIQHVRSSAGSAATVGGEVIFAAVNT